MHVPQCRSIWSASEHVVTFIHDLKRVHMDILEKIMKSYNEHILTAEQ